MEASWAVHVGLCMVGCAWWAVHYGLCMLGCAWWVVHSRLCIVDCAWWAVPAWVVQKPTGENLQAVWGRVFNSKLGCFPITQVVYSVNARAI